MCIRDRSSKMGKKDIIKVECPIESLDHDILGFIDHNITVNVIKGDKIVDKMEPVSYTHLDVYKRQS